MKLRSKKGFSLVELIIVIAILGIIAVIAVPNLTGIQQRSQVNADIRTAEQIGKAVRIWITDSGAGNDNYKKIENKWIRIDDTTSLPGFSSYISTEYVPTSYTEGGNKGAYWVGATMNADKTESHVYVAIDNETSCDKVSTSIAAYTAGTAGGLAYGEGFAKLTDAVDVLKADAGVQGFTWTAGTGAATE